MMCETDHITAAPADRLHRFEGDVSELALPERFGDPFHYVVHPLAEAASRQVRRYALSRADWAADLAAGKMLGVLVVRDAHGEMGFLAAFSGNLAGGNNHPYFVPPIVDLLDPDGVYRRGEAEISAINREIAQRAQSARLATLRQQLAAAEAVHDAQLASMDEQMRAAKTCRHALRASGALSSEESAALDRESAHLKAERKRLRARHAAHRQQLQQAIAAHEQAIARLKTQRATMSEALQRRLFTLYVVSNAHGERRTVLDVWQWYASNYDPSRAGLPPGGTGECCAPKLLQYAYDHRLCPVCMAEFWVCDPAHDGEVENRRNGDYCQACEHKCRPLLTFMLQGLDVERATPASDDLEVVYSDERMVVVNKPAGMLSVPGRDHDVASALTMASAKQGEQLLEVHRLDMATSGLLVLARTAQSQRELRAMWERGEVRKTYVAVVDGVPSRAEGEIALPLRPDYALRPRQVVDMSGGRHAVTRYRVVAVDYGRALVEFHPLTGRTHQLRVHSSHPQGLGCPIVGDALYGHAGSRLMLHAARLQFPDGLVLSAPVPFGLD